MWDIQGTMIPLRVKKYSPTKSESLFPILYSQSIKRMNNNNDDDDAKLLIFNGRLSSLASGFQQIPRLLLGKSFK